LLKMGLEVSQESLKNFKASLEGEKKNVLCLWCKFRMLFLATTSRAATNTTTIIATSGRRNGVKMNMCTGGEKQGFFMPLVQVSNAY